MVGITRHIISTILAFTIFALTGCADLLIRDWDEPEDKVNKVVARVLLCPITLCLSELDLALIKEREEREERQAQYWRWVHSLPPEEQDRHYRLEEARIQAAGRAMMGFWMGGGFQNTAGPAQPLYQPAPTPVMPLAPAVRPAPPVSCTSRAVGQMVYTDCY
jgi:hypothetical protein